jgi:hypothetical protein
VPGPVWLPMVVPMLFISTGPVQLREGGLHQLGQRPRVGRAVGIGDVALAAVVGPALGKLRHARKGFPHGVLSAPALMRGMSRPRLSMFMIGQMLRAPPKMPAALEMRPPLT